MSAGARPSRSASPLSRPRSRALRWRSRCPSMRSGSCSRCSCSSRRGRSPGGPAGNSHNQKQMSDPEELWIPLVDEPIGSIVEQIQRENPDIAQLVESPHRILAFRTFAYIRVGILLGQLLFDNDVPAYDGSENWIDALLRDPAHHEALTQEIRVVAEEIAADPKYADEGPLGPDDAARDRFRVFAREHLGSTQS